MSFFNSEIYLYVFLILRIIVALLNFIDRKIIIQYLDGFITSYCNLYAKFSLHPFWLVRGLVKLMLNEPQPFYFTSNTNSSRETGQNCIKRKLLYLLFCRQNFLSRGGHSSIFLLLIKRTFSFSKFIYLNRLK